MTGELSSNGRDGEEGPDVAATGGGRKAGSSQTAGTDIPSGPWPPPALRPSPRNSETGARPQPSVPCRGHRPVKGERRAWQSLVLLIRHSTGSPALRPSPPPERSEERGPIGCQSGRDGAPVATRGRGASGVASVRKRRRPRSPSMARGFAPAATGGDRHIRRGCQWVPGQAGDDGRGGGKADTRPAAPPSCRHPGQGEAATRGPFVPRAAATGARRSALARHDWPVSPRR
jgi:hypothetical protein